MAVFTGSTFEEWLCVREAMMVRQMFGIFKSKLNAKNIFFELNKQMVETICSLRQVSFDEKRPRKISFDERVDNTFNESAALGYFLVAAALKANKLDRQVEAQIDSFLKGYCSAYLPSLSKDDSLALIDDRYAEYFETFSNGFDEAAICQKFLDFQGIRWQGEQVLENFDYTSIIGRTLLNGIKIVGSAQNNFKVVPSGKLSKEEIKRHADEISKITAKYRATKKTGETGMKSIAQAEYEKYQAKMKSIGTFLDEIEGGHGPFGLCATNPVPTTSTQASADYLKRLRAEGKSKLSARRIGSTSADDVTDGMIDIYELEADGEHVTNIYVYPYHNKNSEKAPNGFSLR